MLTNVKTAWVAAGVLAAALAGGGYQYTSRTSGLESRLRTLEDRLRSQKARERAETAASLKGERKEIQEERERLTKDMEAIRTDIARLLGQRTETAGLLKGRRKELEEESRRLTEQLAAIRKDIARSRGRQTEKTPVPMERQKELEEEKRRVSGERRKLQAARQDVALLKTKVGETATLLKEREKVFEEARQDIARLETKLSETSTRLKTREGELERSRAGLARANEEIEKLRLRNASATKAVVSVRSENERLRGQLDEFAAKVRKLGRASLESRATRESLREKIGQLRSGLEKAARRKEREIRELRASHRLLLEKLKAGIKKEEVSVKREKEHISIRLLDRVLFKTGNAEMTEGSKETLDQIFSGLGPIKGGLVVIEGHADDRKIHGTLAGEFASNWELSLARAASVIRYLQSKGMDPRRMSVAGYSYYRPADTNLTAVGRSRNRRVEIKLIPPGYSVADEMPAVKKR